MAGDIILGGDTFQKFVWGVGTIKNDQFGMKPQLEESLNGTNTILVNNSVKCDMENKAIVDDIGW